MDQIGDEVWRVGEKQQPQCAGQQQRPPAVWEAPMDAQRPQAPEIGHPREEEIPDEKVSVRDWDSQTRPANNPIASSARQKQCVEVIVQKVLIDLIKAVGHANSVKVRREAIFYASSVYTGFRCRGSST